MQSPPQDAELLALSCGSVPPPDSPSSPLTPLTPHPSSPMWLLFIHTVFIIVALFKRVNHGRFPLASSRIVKLIYWKYQSAGGEGEPRQIYVTSVCTLPPRGRGLQLQEDRPERLDECTELWVAGIQMQRGPSALNYIKGPFFFLSFFLKVHWVTKMEKIYASMFLVG